MPESSHATTAMTPDPARENERCRTIIFDGECPFCQRQMAWIASRAVPGDFDFVPRQTPGLTERFPFLAQSDFNSGLRLVLPDGTLRVGADGVYEIVRRLPRWRRLAWLYRVPVLHALAKLVYAWIARRRQSLARTCEDERCETSPERTES